MKNIEIILRIKQEGLNFLKRFMMMSLGYFGNYYYGVFKNLSLFFSNLLFNVNRLFDFLYFLNTYFAKPLLKKYIF